MIYPVRCSPGLLEKAKADYPDSAAVEGRPTFRQFERGPLAAARYAFTHWHRLPAPVEAVAIKNVHTAAVALFGPMVFTAALLTDGTVEIIDYLSDDGYWELVGDDPED